MWIRWIGLGQLTGWQLGELAYHALLPDRGVWRVVPGANGGIDGKTDNAPIFNVKGAADGTSQGVKCGRQLHGLIIIGAAVEVANNGAIGRINRRGHGGVAADKRCLQRGEYVLLGQAPGVDEKTEHGQPVDQTSQEVSA